MAAFTPLISRLSQVRSRFALHIAAQGASATLTDTLYELAYKVKQIPSGIQYVRSGYQLFKGNTSLSKLPAYLDFRQLTSMYQMCYGCTALTQVGVLETANVTNMMWAFYGCETLTRIDGLDTSAITSASELFHGCSSLVTIVQPLDFSNVKSQIDTTFTACRNLESVSFTGAISVDIWVNGCPKLTLESLLSLLNALADGVTDKTCTLGTKNLAKLSETQKAIATSKGWTLQ